MRKMLLLLALTAPVLCWAGPEPLPPTTQSARDASWAQPIQLQGVPNLHRVSPTLFRSAQPTKEGMARLAQLGIKTVINLRSFHSDDEETENTGLKTFHIPMKAWHAEKEDVVRFLRIVNDPANQPVLIHCMDGADRTGTMCAIYRMAAQGWTKEQALREMTDGGYGFHEVWQNLKEWLEHVDVAEIRRDAGM